MADGGTVWGSGASFPSRCMVPNFAHALGNAYNVLGKVDEYARDVCS